jgi:hypothetical protein
MPPEDCDFFHLLFINSVRNKMSFVSSKENNMASLKSLTLTALPQIQADPVMDRRKSWVPVTVSYCYCAAIEA